MAVEDQHGGAKAIGVLDKEGGRDPNHGDGVAERRRGEVASVLPDVAGVDRVGTAEGVAEHLPRPHPLVAGVPDGVAFQAGDGRDALACPVRGVGHALEGLEGVEAVDLEVAAGGDEHFLDRPAERDFELRPSPGDRQAGAGHQGDVQRLGLVDHLVGLGPAVVEMLVDEDRAIRPEARKTSRAWRRYLPRG